MHKKRITNLSEDIRDHVFSILDSEIEFSANECGEVAQTIQDAFLDAMEGLDVEPTKLCKTCCEPGCLCYWLDPA